MWWKWLRMKSSERRESGGILERKLLYGRLEQRVLTLCGSLSTIRYIFNASGKWDLNKF
jgi:hypothetical protein